ncbi:M4 family metallopeptidase [Chitinophagaceae bacterium MMS25-I14]
MNTKSTLFLAAMLVATEASAQTAEKLSPGNAGMYPAAIEFRQGQEPLFTPGKVWLKQQENFKTVPAVLLRKEADKLGQEHYRYQQYEHGIPVDGATYIVHTSAGKVISENGAWVADMPEGLETKASLTADEALQKAMQAFGARSYKWQLAGEEEFIKRESNDAAATFYPQASLVYYMGETGGDVSKMRLAYKLDLYAHDPLGRRIYFIDAVTGKVLGVRELLHTTGAVGTAQTVYSGPQTINTDSYNGSYRLREATRGNGIQTYNLQRSTNYNNAVDFTDADNNWNNINTNLDQYATDAHWGAEKTYDFYLSTFGRNSIDGNGFALKSYVHYSTNYFNAFWDGTRMTYGDGSSTDNHKPLTAMDVCGHEITHGLTSYTANLNYSNESGALNEGFSDCMGTSIEFYAKPATGNWLIGEDFYTIRSMSDPKAYGQPNTYKGINWATGSADNGGVHTNSGVLNYWYYLLSSGGSGTNDNGTAYSVSGIGISKAAAITYRTLTIYLTPTSVYTDARTYSLKAAADLYGAGSNEVTQTINAWIAVGVDSVAAQPACTDNYESNETKNAAKKISVNTDITAKIGTSTDKDWFYFTTTNSAPKLKVTLSNLPADYDIRLYNNSGSQIGISQNGGTAAESIVYNANKGATYYVQVYGYAGAYNAGTCYALRASTSSVNQLADDGNDDNEITELKPDGESVINNSLLIYPNPARDVIHLRFGAEKAGLQTVVITDVVGRVVLTVPLAVQEGSNDLQLSLNGLGTGMYLLKLDGGQVMKMQVIR